MRVRNDERARILDPVDRISEVLFGLIMAVTIVGSLSVATADRQEVRVVMAAALGCNLAWGLVDALMHLVRTMTERSRLRALARKIAAAPPAAGERLLREALPAAVLALSDAAALDGMRRRAARVAAADGPLLTRDDLVYAIAIFAIVVLATFPVVVPFLLTDDLRVALLASQATTLAMLFIAGWTLARYAGQARPVWLGVVMAVLGALVIAAVRALGG